MTELRTTYAAPIEDLELRDADGRHFLEGICVPYLRITHKAGALPEQFQRGAFSDAVTSQAPIKLIDYNHSRTRIPVGRSVKLEERSEGLWARFQINKTPEGEGAYLNASEGVYGGLSVGFIAGAEQQLAGVRTITSARLHHVSLVEEPAYEDAVLLDVRSAQSELDDLRRLFAAPVQSTDLDIAQPLSFTELMTRMRR